jgi:molybdate transport system regulatory protein
LQFCFNLIPSYKKVMPDVPILKIKIQLYCCDEIAMGPGKADLLDAIKREGSISAAGRAMGMSYRRTWLLVDAMNRCWQEPLVETNPGNSRGVGARVTPFGESVLSHFRSLQNDIATAATCPARTALTKAMRATPIPTKA